MVQLTEPRDGKQTTKKIGGRYALPIVPSAFFACHHFPCLSTMSRTSPLVNDISLGSSGEAVSTNRRQSKEHNVGLNTHKRIAL